MYMYRIQIQLLLKLNCNNGVVYVPTMDSNTTLVKVKFD